MKRAMKITPRTRRAMISAPYRRLKSVHQPFNHIVHKGSDRLEGEPRTRCGPLIRGDLAIAQHKEDEHQPSSNQESTKPIHALVDVLRVMLFVRLDTVETGGHSEHTES